MVWVTLVGLCRGWAPWLARDRARLVVVGSQCGVGRRGWFVTGLGRLGRIRVAGGWIAGAWLTRERRE